MNTKTSSPISYIDSVLITEYNAAMSKYKTIQFLPEDIDEIKKLAKLKKKNFGIAVSLREAVMLAVETEMSETQVDDEN